MDIVLLTKEQLVGDNALESMKDYGVSVGASDCAMVLGLFASNGVQTIEGDAASSSWLMEPEIHYSSSPLHVRFDGLITGGTQWSRDEGIRPVLPPAETSNITANNLKNISLSTGKTITVCEYGEYPQTMASPNIAGGLENLYRDKKLKSTSKRYTFNRRVPFTVLSEKNPNDDKYKLETHKEYEFNGQKYVRIHHFAEHDGYYEHTNLSTGDRVKPDGVYWFKVEPIEWIMDKTGYWISKKNLVSGVGYTLEKDKDSIVFSNCYLKKYMNKYLSKEMQVAEKNNNNLFLKNIQRAFGGR